MRTIAMLLAGVLVCLVGQIVSDSYLAGWIACALWHAVAVLIDKCAMPKREPEFN